MFELGAKAIALDLEIPDVVSQRGDEEVDFAVTALRVFAQSPGFAREVAQRAGFDHRGPG
ncbi:MAG: hypothetical protein ABI782_00800 [Anaerolineaceae bacterium]